MCLYFFALWWQMCPIFFNDKYMSRVFMHNEKYIYGFQIVVDEAPPQLSSHSLGVIWFCCGHWFRSTLLLSCTALASTRLWVSFLWWFMSDREFLDLVFAMFFFVFIYCHLFSFCSVVMKMGCGFVPTMWFGPKIMVFWIEDMSSLVQSLFCWMHISIQLDWFYLDVARKG